MNIKPSLSRSAGEISIIVVGVLIALAVNSWNDNRIDRMLERQYLERSLADAQGNEQSLSSIFEALDQKLSALRSLDSLIREPERLQSDAKVVLTALAVGANFGWTFPAPETGTYDEILSTGRLVLFRDVELRALLVKNNRSLLEGTDRINARRTRYPAYVYNSLSPEQTFDLIDAGGAQTSAIVSAALSERVIRGLRSEEFLGLLNAEQNYATFARQIIMVQLQEIENTKAAIKAALED